MDTISTFKKLSSISTINSGGCGIAALSMVRWAEKNNQEKPAIVFLYDSYEEEEATKNISLIESGHIKSAYTPSHIALLVGDEVVDSREDCPLDRYEVAHSGVTPEELLELINSGNWNDWFSREKHVPQIEHMLDIDLSDVLWFHK